VDTTSVPQPHEHGEQGRPYACYEGTVYVGHVVEDPETGVEVFEGVPCRRCKLQFVVGE
jgi:hypothetical protein